jgi:aminoglycoside phosphotransferase (APT) family kinase protein
MRAAEAQRAVAAARSTASSLGLAVDDAVVLNDSNRLVVHLTPCDVVARATPMAHFASADLEVEVVRQLAGTDSPVAALDPRVEPRVFVRDGFRLTMWAYVAPVRGAVPATDYARALGQLHGGLQRVTLTTPHVMDRVAEMQRDVASVDVTPDLADTDRALLASTLEGLRRSIVSRRTAEQLLHGEPHPWNVLHTEDGPRFIDFENTARGPVEYDLAWVPEEVTERYQDVDPDLLDECRGIVLAIIATHRWSRDDRHPSGRESGIAFLDALREGSPYRTLDTV